PPPPSPRSRRQDLFSIDNAWERLHHQVIEIRDSIFYLHDTWAWNELVERARREAEIMDQGSGRRLVTIAFWLEVTPRAGLRDAAKLNRDLDKTLLPSY
ncbi:MAG: hypothetical protein M3460_24575, partial [Actinomycetota bacterium]|nr:hypothetical protein [Actinomycetota bacterium]